MNLFVKVERRTQPCPWTTTQRGLNDLTVEMHLHYMKRDDAQYLENDISQIIHIKNYETRLPIICCSFTVFLVKWGSTIDRNYKHILIF